MNNFLTDKYFKQNILIFNHLDNFGKIRAKFQVKYFGITDNLKMS